MKIRNFKLKILLSLISFPFFTSFVFAQTAIPIGSKYGFGNITSLGQGVSRLVSPAFQVAGATVVIFLTFGAFKYLTSGGEKEAIDDARKMMTGAFIGFLILMFSFLALKYLLYILFGITGTGFELINSQ